MDERQDDDRSPDISETRATQVGWRRAVQVVTGVLLVLVGIVMAGPGVPGPGLFVVVVGLNMVKPGNRLSMWIRKKAPGIPDEGPIPVQTILIGVTTAVVAMAIGIIFRDQIRNVLSQLIPWDLTPW